MKHPISVSIKPAAAQSTLPEPSDVLRQVSGPLTLSDSDRGRFTATGSHQRTYLTGRRWEHKLDLGVRDLLPVFPNKQTFSRHVSYVPTSDIVTIISARIGRHFC